MWHFINGILIFILTLGVIMQCPYRISDAVALAVRAALMFIGRLILDGEALQLRKGDADLLDGFTNI
jgi:hypothetical protein